MAVLERANFCPATAMIETYKIAMQKFVEDAQAEESGKMSPMESKAAVYLRIAGDMSKDLASYSYPKLKALEVVKDDRLKGMTPEQKLEAMRQAVQMLELQVKKEETK